MKISSIKKLLLLSFFIISANSFTVYSVYKSNQQLTISQLWVEHSEQVIYKTESIFSLSKDIESGSRGFVITNDSSYLAPLLLAEKSTIVHLAQLRQLINDNALQLKLVDSLDHNLRKRLSYSMLTVDLRNRQGLDATIDFINGKQGKYYSDQIRSITNNIQQNELALLKQRRQANEQSIQTFKLFSEGMLILMSVLTILLLVVSGNYLLQRNGNEKRSIELGMANTALAFENQEKAKRAAELTIANTELAFQNTEKEKRAAELIIANTELAFESGEKEKRATELTKANWKLFMQNGEKEDRAAELIIANTELAFESKEKEKRAAELMTANWELHFQNGEKEKRAAELLLSNSDLTASKQKIIQINRFYDLIGKLNESIVRVKEVKTLFRNACDMVFEMGLFKTAWIGIFDEKNKTISLAEQSGMAIEDIGLFYNVPYQSNDSHDYILRTGKYFISTNIQQDLKMEKWKRFGASRGIHSLMILPIKKGGNVIGTLNLYAATADFTGKEEIELLERVVEDISFALDLFENAKIQQETAALLVQNEKRFRSLIEKGVDMITLRSPEGQIYYASPSVTDVLNRSNEELLNTSVYELVHPEDIPGLLKQVDSILTIPGGYFFRRQRYLHKNGHWIWCEGHVTNMLHEPGIHALVSNFRDISEKKKREEQREFDKNNLYALINNTNDLMWSVDRDLKLITSNQPFTIIANGIKKGVQTPGSNIFPACYSKEKLNRFQQYYQRALAGETFTAIEHDETPTPSWSELSYYPICKEDEVIGTACYSRDITKSKLAEQTLTNITIDLEKRIKELEQFAYIVSHNLRAPVANILGASFMLNHTGLIAEKKQELSRGLHDSVLKLDEVIKDLNEILNVKREISQIREPVFFSELVENIKISIKNLIDKDSISIQYDFTEINELVTLKKYIYSIFYNLISNSIKYRQPQMPSLIEIKSQVVNDRLCLTFKDNGLGIDLDKNGPLVFGLYKRFHDQINGKGVGLFMVKTQVETLGGTISIKSEINKGTTFKIEFKI
jgi:PAS domain S-box-containing protein